MPSTVDLFLFCFCPGSSFYDASRLVSDTFSALMSDAVAHTLDGCEVQPLGEELNPEKEELLVDMDVVRERGLEIINTTAYIAITGSEPSFKRNATFDL